MVTFALRASRVATYVLEAVPAGERLNRVPGTRLSSGGFFLQDDSTLDDQGEFLNTSTGAFLSDAGVWTDNSDRNLKQDFAEVEPRRVLAKLADLPVRSWSYEAEPGVRHVGPVAQDFHAAFGLGADDRHIASLDSAGVALAAIKGLIEENERLEQRISALERGGR